MKLAIVWLLLLTIANVVCFSHDHKFVETAAAEHSQEVNEDVCFDDVILEEHSETDAKIATIMKSFYQDYHQHQLLVPLEIITPPPDSIV